MKNGNIYDFYYVMTDVGKIIVALEYIFIYGKNDDKTEALNC